MDSLSKLVVLFLLSCSVCVINCHLNCNLVQMMIVKKQWSTTYAVSAGRQSRVEMGQEIWTELLEKFPEVKSKYLRRVNAANTTSQAFKDFTLNVLGGFDISVALLGDKDVLKAQLDHLKAKHDYEEPIPDKCFDLFLEILMRIVQRKVGDAFDKAAWVNCGSNLMEAMH